MIRGSDSVDEAIDIQRALAGLTAKQRRAVELAMAGYSQVDIAAMLGIHRNTVRRRIIRARKGVHLTLFSACSR